jgi:uncharacterized membrane protein YebE (DUF533 family)
MSFGDILGQIMQQGLGGQAQNRGRMQTTARNMSGGGLDSIFGQLQGALGRAGIDTAGLQQTAGGFADKAGDFIRKDQVGGLSGAQVGGIGAIAGALLGGGLGGAARGGAMAVLGTLALSALKSAQAKRAGASALPPVEPQEVAEVTAPAAEQLLLTAMISAAKADGTIDQAEMQKIVGKISEDSVTPAEKQFVLDQMAAPVDVAAIAAKVKGLAQAGLRRIAPCHRQRQRRGAPVPAAAGAGARPRHGNRGPAAPDDRRAGLRQGGAGAFGRRPLARRLIGQNALHLRLLDLGRLVRAHDVLDLTELRDRQHFDAVRVDPERRQVGRHRILQLRDAEPPGGGRLATDDLLDTHALHVVGIAARHHVLDLGELRQRQHVDALGIHAEGGEIG